MEKYNVVILAGGRCPWLKEFAGTDVRCLAKINGKRMLDYIIEAIHESGRVKRILFVGNPEMETSRECIAVTYPGFVNDLKIGGTILIDDGDLESCICKAIAYNSSIFISLNGSKKDSILAPLKNPPFTGDFFVLTIVLIFC